LAETVRFTAGRAVLGRDGAAYVAGNLAPPTKTIGTTPLTSAGITDVGILKLNASGNPVWAKTYGDASAQTVNEAAVTDPVTNRLAVVGNFMGQLASLNAGASSWSFLLLVDGASGSVATARSIDAGLSGTLFAAGTNPNLGLVAVCGAASKLAADTTAGAPGTTWATAPAVYGGLTDILIGLYRADGTLLWARQIGTPSREECKAVTIDDIGNVVAAGVYSGTAPNLTLAGATPLPNPGSSFRQWMWVATFDGTTGAGIAQAAFGGGAGQHRPTGIALDPAGNVLVSALFSSTIPFDGSNTACTTGTVGCLASAGGLDGVVMKLTSALAPIWATRVGAALDDAMNGVAVDSFGNVIVSGDLLTSATASTVTATTTETAPVGDGPSCVPATPSTCALTAPPGTARASYVAKLPGSTGLFDVATATVTGNTHDSSADKISVNRFGAGALKDALLWDGVYSTSLTFAPLSPLVAIDPTETFVVFGVLQ
jgi:hypothetical protein